ncbi:MAG: ATP-binding protein [Polyangiaceae bacterium]|nr:ATP-binding protein [Polyangiaceae bacterium]
MTEWLAAGLLAVATAAAILAHRHATRCRALSAELASLRSGAREHEAIARIAADGNPDAIVLFTDDGDIAYANPAARELFFEGRAPEGRNFLRLLAAAPDTLREALTGDAERLFTVDSQGQRETYHVCRCLVGMRGEPHTMLIVKQLTREVSRREVSTLKTVVRVISHEVNNSLAPITSLVGSARLMLERPEHRARLVQALDTIEERARHLQTFLDGYAGLARLPKPRLADVSLGPLFEHLRSLFPEIDLPGAPALPAHVDPAQLEQVLINLIKNAVEAGSPAAEVAVRAEVQESGAARVEVTDRGRGLSREALESAFLPLYTTKESGSGIGLTICREIVEAHGGSLTLANREGGGARVALILPARQPLDGTVLRSRSRLTLSHV